MKNKKKVLILCPHPDRKGGVAYYYRVISKYLSEEAISIQYYFTGKKSDTPNLWSRFKNSVKDIFSLLKSFSHYDLVHLNPSLDAKALFRDGCYHFIAKRIFRKKTLVFFHGWSPDIEQKITSQFAPVFKFFFNCDCIMVLATAFKKTLVSWGYDENRIIFETTTVDDALLAQFSINKRLARIGNGKPIKLLFLSRIEETKGIKETIETFVLLSKKHPHVQLTIAGTGSFMAEARKFAASVSKENICFTGYVNGEDKVNVYLGADFFLFPTYYAEGMPIAILEAMAMGLPVITRPVAGLKDFLKNGDHGFMMDTKNPSDFAACIDRLIDDPQLWSAMAATSHQYALNHFMSSKVALRIEARYKNILSCN